MKNQKQIEAFEFRLKYYEKKFKSAGCFKCVEKYLKKVKRLKKQINELKKLL